MTISIIVRQFTNKVKGNTFTSASAKGKFLEGANKITEADAETTFDVKFVGAMLPTKEGIYTVEADDIWRDTREQIKFPTVRCKNIKSVTFKAELKPLNK